MTDTQRSSSCTHSLWATRMWAPQQSAFPGWRVITPALPGFDYSHASASSMDAFAAHVNHELDRLEIGSAVIGDLSLVDTWHLGCSASAPSA